MNELEQLRTRAAQWTLADDSKLITILSSLVDSMVDRGRSLDSSLSSTSSAISRLHGQLDTAESAIGLYSGTHFIEQRVLDDDYRPRKPTQPEPPLTLQQRQTIILGELRQAVNEGLNVIDTCFRPLGDKDDPLRQYEPVDRYNRPIPPIIGSSAFHAMGKKKAEPTREVTITVDQPTSLGEVPSPISSSMVSPPSLSSTSSQFIGISAYPPASSAPPPPPPPMPAKISPTPSLPLDRSSLQAEITSVLDRARGEFRVPHDKGPEDVDAGLTPPLPPRSVHPTQAPLAPILPPRASVQYATPPELPPKITDKPSTSSSVPLPAEPKKKSIFDFDSDDDDFAAVLSRPSKTAASSSTLSSSMRSNESDNKSTKSQEERKESEAKPTAPQSLVSELAVAAANKRAQQLAAGGTSAPPPIQFRSVDALKKTETASHSMPPPIANSTPVVKKEEKVEESKSVPKKAAWVPKKSIFDDEDSDFDELFKPAAKKTSTVKKEEKKEEVKREEPKKIEVKKDVVEVPKPPPQTSKPAEKPKRKNIFDDDSDFEDLFKPKAPAVKKPLPTVEKKKEETPEPKAPIANPHEQLVTKKEEKREERKEEKQEPVKVSTRSEHTEVSPPPFATPPQKVEESGNDPLSQISVDPVVCEKKEKEEEKKEIPVSIDPLAAATAPEVKEEPAKEEVKQEEPISVDPLTSSTTPEVKEAPVKEEIRQEVPQVPRVEKAFTPLRESPPPFEELAPVSKWASEEPASIPEDEEEPAQTSKKDLPVRFDSPPPFEKLPEEEEEKHDEGEDAFSEDSDTEVMQGNRAAFMAQLNAKLAAKPPSGLGIRPMSMVETPSAPFVAPTSDRQSVVLDRQPITRRAASEGKEGPISHVNKSRPKGPARRPPTAKKLTSSSDSDEGASKSATSSTPLAASTTVPKPADPITVPRSMPPKSPVSSSPVKETPVVFRKTSDPKSPPASNSRKSSSSSLGPDADPLSALSAVHTSPYKGPSANKPPISSMPRVSVSPSATKPESAVSSTQKTDTKPKKSVFDSDSDDFFEKLGSSKTLPAKSSAFKSELESALSKDKKGTTTTKKGIFDDSDEDLEMFRKKK